MIGLCSLGGRRWLCVGLTRLVECDDESFLGHDTGLLFCEGVLEGGVFDESLNFFEDEFSHAMAFGAERTGYVWG